MVAVCPMEHDLAYSEHEEKCFVSLRKDAEKEAFAANPNFSMLTTNLVYGNQPSYMF